MNWRDPSLLWRVLSGLFLAILGILITRQYLPEVEFLGGLKVERALAALTFGAFGYFLVPMLAEIIRGWSVALSGRVALEVVKQMRLFSQKKKNHNNKTPKVLWPNPMVLDTSAIIDGRLSDIAQTGFLRGTLLVPKLVLSELQQVADSKDSLRRSRGRRGLDILAQLKKSKWLKLVVIKDDIPGPTVDQKLLTLAGQVHGCVITTDFNLNKVAEVENIPILNVNALANAVKTVVLPGESLEIKVIQQGKSPDQGVGYLPDGTMVVVEKGAALVGEEITVIVARILQTVAGRMIFSYPQ